MKLLVDISGLAHASIRKYNLTDTKGQGTSAIYGVLRSLESLASYFGPEAIVVCFDGGSALRKEIYPEYKANRNTDDPVRAEVSTQLKKLRELLQATPIQTVYVPEVEADDLIAYLSSHLKEERITIITRDSDLHQLVRASPAIHDLADFDGTPIAPKWKSPSELIIYKCLVGDSSDGIKGVTGIGKVKATALIQEHRTLKRILTFAKAQGGLGRMDYKDVFYTVRRNLKLIRLDGSILTQPQKDAILLQYETSGAVRTFNVHAFEMWLMELNFRSIESRLSTFLNSFETLLTAKPDLSHKLDEEDLDYIEASDPSPRSVMEKKLEAIKHTGAWLSTVTDEEVLALVSVVRLMQDSNFTPTKEAIDKISLFIKKHSIKENTFGENY